MSDFMQYMHWAGSEFLTQEDQATLDTASLEAAESVLLNQEDSTYASFD